MTNTNVINWGEMVVAEAKDDIFAPLNKMIATSTQADLRKADIKVNPAKLVAQGKALVVDGTAYDFTKKSITDLSIKVGQATNPQSGADGKAAGGQLPAAWLLNDAHDFEAQEIIGGRLTMWAQKGIGRDYLMRTMRNEGGNGGELRAMLAGDYPLLGDGNDFENTTILKLIKGVLVEMVGDNNGGQLITGRCFVDGNRISGRVYLKGIDLGEMIGDFYAGKMAYGFAFKTSEIGDGSLEFMPAAWRTQCSNSIVVANKSQGAVKMSHNASVSLMRAKMADCLAGLLPASLEVVKRLVYAEKVQVNFAAMEDKFMRNFGWVDPKTNAIVDDFKQAALGFRSGAEGQTETLAGFVNALTAVAHLGTESKNGKLYQFDEETQLSIENYAADVLFAGTRN